jgi:predicted exporter
MINRLKSFHASLSWAWLILILSLGAYQLHALFNKERVQFDLLALLPDSNTGNLTAVTQFMRDVNLSNRLLILVGHQDASKARSALISLRRELNQLQLPIKEQNTTIVSQKYKDLYRHLYPYRAGLLAPEDRHYLLNKNGEMIEKRAISQMMLPFASLAPVQLDKDPFSLYPAFVKAIQPITSVQSDAHGDLCLINESKTWYLFRADLTQPAFSLQVQEEFSGKLLPFLDKLKQKENVEVLKTGAIFYATSGSQQANSEISLIGTLSTVATILLLIVVFKTVRPLFFAMSVILSGIVGGLSACLFLFKSVHILVLVFGCSLVGITVDYALHYFCASYKGNKDPMAVLNSLMPALPLSVLSSVLGFALLIFVPFPGIQQMAVLASMGLLCAFLSVYLWGPYFVKSSGQKILPLGQKIQFYLEQFAHFGSYTHYRKKITVGLLILFGIGSCFLRFEDNVRNFQALDGHLKQEEERIKSMMKIDHASKFLTITGKNWEEVLQLEEQLVEELDQIQQVNEISGYRHLSALIPSQQRQRENRQLIVAELYRPYGSQFAKALGMNRHFKDQDLGLDAPYLVINQEHLKLLPEGWNELVSVQEGKVVGRILLNNVTNEQRIEALVYKYPNIKYIDPVQEYSHLFSCYRQVILSLIAVLLLCSAVLLSILASVKVAAVIIFPILLSLLASIGVIGLCQIPFTLFHAMGLLLVLCIGVDYAFFLYWRKPTQDTEKTTDFSLLSNVLAALTTILSFGLLGLSKTAAVRGFGIALFVGIILCFCVTTLFLGKPKVEERYSS